MIVNGIKFPNRLIEAIEEGRLVVFAGAGVSRGAPTKLPGFRLLTEVVAKGTGIEIGKRKDYENVLGEIKERYNLDVNQKAANILCDSCLKSNKLHEAIVNLFKDEKSIRIVTTNYDMMFEKVLDKQHKTVFQYSAPALPLGNDFSGIVHVHGIVNQPLYMVMTDEDFGTAYITEGYSSRFLSGLFENYVVLFVGYSYNDTIVKYLTRSIAKKKKNNLFVLTDSSRDDWQLLGIEPIRYRKRTHAQMRKALVDIGNYVKRSFSSWKKCLGEFVNCPPTDEESASEIIHILHNVQKARLLSKCIGGSDWTDFLVKNGAFSEWVNPQYVPSEIDDVWLDWVADECSDGNEALLDIMSRFDGCALNTLIAQRIITRLSTSRISNRGFAMMLMVLKEYPLDSIQSIRLIRAACQRKMYTEAIDLFLQMFKPAFFVVHTNETENKTRLASKFRCDLGQVKYAWDKISDGDYANSARLFLEKTIALINSIYNQCYNNDSVDNENALFLLSLIDVETSEDEIHQNPLAIFPRVFCFFSERIGSNESEALFSLLKECTSGQFVFLREIALRALRESRTICVEKKYEILKDELSLWNCAGSRQEFLLMENVVKQVDEKHQEELLAIIKKTFSYSEEGILPREIYTWAEWMQRTVKNNPEIDRLVKLGEERGYSPRKNPGYLFEIEEIHGCSPISKEEMKKKRNIDLLKYIIAYKPNDSFDISEIRLRDEFVSCVREAEFEWVYGLMEGYFSLDTRDDRLLEDIQTGIKGSHATKDDLWKTVKILANNVEKIDDMAEASSFLQKAVQSDATLETYKKYKEVFWQSVTSFLKKEGGRIANKVDSIWGEVCYNCTGLVALSAIAVLNCAEDVEVNIFLNLFEKMLDTRKETRKLTVCVLSGYLDLLWYRAREWCERIVIPWLKGTSPKEFTAAWTGVLYENGAFGPSTKTIHESVFIPAIKKQKDWGNEETEKSIVETISESLVYASDQFREINNRFIPELYKCLSDKGHEHFVGHIGFLLGKLSDNQISYLWESWLKEFFQNRLNGLPTKAERKEIQELLEWIPTLGLVYTEAINILIGTSNTTGPDYSFWYQWTESGIIARYPLDSLNFLEWLLKWDNEKSDNALFINDAQKQIRAVISDKDIKRLDELLIENGFE